MESYLYHYGIAGQKWGIRRFQNEDGTLTEEGKRRYEQYNLLTDKQKKIFDNKMSDRQRDRIMKKLGEGKSWSKGIWEVGNEEKRKRLAVASVAALAGTYLLLPEHTQKIIKSVIKSSGKALFRTVKNSNAVQRGSLWLKKMATRRDMVKKGAVVLKKSAYSVRDIPFGGYLA